MNKKSIKLSLSIILISFSVFKLNAQIGSPYSQFGIGDLNHPAFGSYKSMGGIGIGLKSKNHLNVLNPASLSSIDSLTVLYELGLSGVQNKIETDLGSTTKYGTNIDYFALGFRLHKRVATSFGVLPASNVDYTFKTSRTMDYIGQIDNYFHGNGGLSSIYWSNSFSPIDGLALGVEAKFLFGSINNVKTIVFANDGESSSTKNLKVDEQKNINGFKFKFGGQYQIDLKNDYHIVLGATYEHKTKANFKVDSLAGTISGTMDPDDITYYQNFYLEEIDLESVYSSENESKVSLPSAMGFGFSINKPQLFTYGLDVEIQNWSEILESDYNSSFNNSLNIRTGGEFIPDHDNINYYLKRVSYRIGAHYTKSHYNIYDNQIEDYGISFGVGLPLRNTKTTFNISFEYGQRGTLDKNLLRETYGIVSLNLSLSDIWFVKRKFK